MTEVLENIIDMLHNAPDKRLELAYVIEKYREDGIITLLPLEQLKLLQQDIKKAVSKELN